MGEQLVAASSAAAFATTREDTLEKGAECLRALYELCESRKISPEDLHYRAASPKRRRAKRDASGSPTRAPRRDAGGAREESDASERDSVAAAAAAGGPLHGRRRRVRGRRRGALPPRRGARRRRAQRRRARPRERAGGAAGAVWLGDFDGDYVVRLLRALDEDGRAAYAALYPAAFVLAFAATAARARVRALVPGTGAASSGRGVIVLCGLVDVGAGLCARAALDARAAAPGVHSGSSLTEGAVGVAYDLPPLGALAPRAFQANRGALESRAKAEAQRVKAEAESKAAAKARALDAKAKADAALAYKMLAIDGAVEFVTQPFGAGMQVVAPMAGKAGFELVRGRIAEIGAFRFEGDDGVSLAAWLDRAKMKPSPDSSLNIRVRDQTGEEVYFKIKPTTQLVKVFNAYAQRKGINVTSLHFFFDGMRVRNDQTPQDIDMEDGDQIDCGDHAGTNYIFVKVGMSRLRTLQGISMDDKKRLEALVPAGKTERSVEAWASASASDVANANDLMRLAERVYGLGSDFDEPVPSFEDMTAEVRNRFLADESCSGDVFLGACVFRLLDSANVSRMVFLVNALCKHKRQGALLSIETEQFKAVVHNYIAAEAGYRGAAKTVSWLIATATARDYGHGPPKPNRSGKSLLHALFTHGYASAADAVFRRGDFGTPVDPDREAELAVVRRDAAYLAWLFGAGAAHLDAASRERFLGAGVGLAVDRAGLAG
ncbi:hypothetical protein SO694_00117041, partial [Aureococcus anophagefferens]